MEPVAQILVFVTYFYRELLPLPLVLYRALERVQVRFSDRGGVPRFLIGVTRATRKESHNSCGHLCLIEET